MNVAQVLSLTYFLFCLLELDRVRISLGSSLVASLGFGFEFFGFQNSKNFWLRVFGGLRKLAQNSSSFRVYGFERKFWPKFGQNPSFFGKIFNSSEMDLIEFQFLGFLILGFGNL